MDRTLPRIGRATEPEKTPKPKSVTTMSDYEAGLSAAVRDGIDSGDCAREDRRLP